jgi:hypothetical protein
MFMFGDLDAYSMVTQHLAWPALRAFRFMIKLGPGFAASHRNLMNIVLHKRRELSSKLSLNGVLIGVLLDILQSLRKLD